MSQSRCHAVSHSPLLAATAARVFDLVGGVGLSGLEPLTSALSGMPVTGPEANDPVRTSKTVRVGAHVGKCDVLTLIRIPTAALSAWSALWRTVADGGN